MTSAQDNSTVPAEVADTNIDLVLRQLPAGSLSAALAKTWQENPPAERASALLNTWKAHGLPKQATDEADKDK